MSQQQSTDSTVTTELASLQLGNQNPEKQQQQFTEEQLQQEIQCETKDGDKIPVKHGWMLQSKVYQDWANQYSWDDGAKLNDIVFPMPQIETTTFKTIVEWLEHEDGDPHPIVERDPNTGEKKWSEFNEFQEEFFKKLDIEEIAFLTNAANYLGLQSLYDAGCQALAKLLKDNAESMEKLRELLGLEDVMTDEEKTEVRAKNRWCYY